MRAVSWILLVLVGLLTVLGALESLSVAYLADPANDIYASTNVQELAAGRAEVETALRARRSTAAAFALAFSVLFVAVVMGPYRRGDTWAWWALLSSALAYSLAAILRIPLLHTRSGAGTAALFLLVTVVALLLDIRRLGKRRL